MDDDQRWRLLRLHIEDEMRCVYEDNYSVYGARKVHAEIVRQGISIARCIVERPMRAAGLHGVSSVKGPRATMPGRWLQLIVATP